MLELQFFIFISYSYLVKLDHLRMIMGERQKVLARLYITVG